MKRTITKPLLAATLFFACVTMADAQLPNEKFGKPTSMEWDYVGWNDAPDADAIILYKSMKATYQISDQVSTNYEGSEVNFDNLADFGKNQIDNGNILVNYEFKLRTKILKPEGILLLKSIKSGHIPVLFFDLISTNHHPPHHRAES